MRSILKRLPFPTAILLATLFSAFPLNAQIISTIAGTGTGGYTGDGGFATAATLNQPNDIVLDGAGNIYISDSGNYAVRRINIATGVISTIVGDGTGLAGYTGDGGPATSARLDYPSGIALDPAGNLFIADYENCVIRKVDVFTGNISTVIGTGTCGYFGDGGPGTSAQLNKPIRITFDATGNLYIADHLNSRIRRWNPTTSIITTVVGTGTQGFSGDNGLATLANINQPEGITFDAAGNLFFTDTGNFIVRRVDAGTGVITTFAGTPGASGYSGDNGPATLAAFSTEPDDILQACNGSIFVSDDFNHVIRMIRPSSGIITTVAGNGTQGYSGDGGAPISAQLNHPEALALDASGNLLVVEFGNATVRRLTLACTTPTPTPGIGIVKQVSLSTAQANNVLTYNIAVSVVGSNFNGVVVTDTFPPEEIFGSFGIVGSGNAVYDAPTSLITWTLADPLTPGVYNLSYGVTIGPLVEGGTFIVNTAQMAYTGQVNPLSSSVTVQVTSPYVTRIEVYNSAGELVRKLSNHKLSIPINEVTLPNNIIGSLYGPNNKSDIYSQGVSLDTWDGTNDNGDLVSNGVYYIKVDTGDNYGAVTSVTREVTVARQLAKVDLNIFNGAGEIVRHLYQYLDDATTMEMNSVDLQSTSFRPGYGDLQVVIVTSTGAPVTLFWDGKNDNGALVSSGHYQLEAHWQNAKGTISDISRGVMLISGFDATLGTVTASTTSLTAANLTTIFTSSSTQVLTLNVKIYTIAGELALQGSGAPGAGTAVWNAQGVASGLYFAVIEMLNTSGELVATQIIKLSVTF